MEALCELMATIGKKFDVPKAREHMNAYFTRINDITGNINLPSRIKFMLEDLIELRRRQWVPRQDANAPKTIREVHKEAAEKEKASEIASRNLRNVPPPRSGPPTDVHLQSSSGGLTISKGWARGAGSADYGKGRGQDERAGGRGGGAGGGLYAVLGSMPGQIGTTPPEPRSVAQQQAPRAQPEKPTPPTFTIQKAEEQANIILEEFILGSKFFWGEGREIRK